jgi:hypothetical protein
MNLPDVIDELFTVLDTVPGVQVPGPGTHATPPAPYVELPDVTYGSGGPGLDRITDLVLTLVVGTANNELVFRQALEFASTSGPRSIRAALMAHDWQSCSTLFVTRAEPAEVEARGNTVSLAYNFHIDITGAP